MVARRAYSQDCVSVRASTNKGEGVHGIAGNDGTIGADDAAVSVNGSNYIATSIANRAVRIDVVVSSVYIKSDLANTRNQACTDGRTDGYDFETGVLY